MIEVIDLQTLKCASQILSNIIPERNKVVDTDTYYEIMETLQHWIQELGESNNGY